MNDETISALGAFCTDLLRAEAFKTLVQVYSQQCAVDMLNAPDATKRENIHAAYTGFNDFLGLAEKFAQDFEAHNNPPDTTEDDPRVHDIYEIN